MKRYIVLAVITLLAAVGLAVQTAPASAQTATAPENATWTISYFNNPYLIGPPAARQAVNGMALNWGEGAPATNVTADNFSAQLATDVYFTAGTYRFYMLSDDRAHLYVDFQSKINNWDDPQVGQIRSVDVTIPTGTIHLQIDFREEKEVAYIFLDWENLADGAQGPNFRVPGTGTPTTPGVWTGEYFNNAGLTGLPFATVNESTITRNWGAGAPLPGMVADNFSVRWMRTLNFDGAGYEIRVAADDGVRVYLDDIVYIDEWHLASGDTYTFTIQPSAGIHTIKVEYYEAFGLANIDFSLVRVGGNTPDPVNTGAYLIVDTGRLNVRNIPTVNGSDVLTKISDGETFAIVGRNADSSWWQINANGLIGWVSAPFVDAFNIAGVPITSNGQNAPTLPPTGYVVTTTANLNIRTGPSTAFERVGQIPNGTSAQVIGRNATSTWWYVRYGTLNGWVSQAYAPIQTNANVLSIPILG